MQPEHSPSDLELARTVAAEAGQLLLRLRAEFGPATGAEDVASLRRRGDLESNELIMRRLRAARPDDAFLTEEEQDDAVRLDAQRVWIVDPLDGTREYGEGRRDFAVQIALWRTATPDAPGRLLCAVVDLPAQGMIRSTGDRAVELPELPRTGPLRVVASRTRPPAQLDQILATWSALTGRTFEAVDVGSVGAKVEHIVSGRAVAYLHDTGFWEWDVAAPMGVAHHYGLALEHWSGDALALNQMPPWVPNVLAVRPELADSLRRAVRAKAQG